MKILYFEKEISGHRLPHLESIINGNNAISIIVAPKPIPSIDCKQYVYTIREKKRRTLKTFLSMLDEVYNICEIEKPDIVHFTDGNIFYRFFGIGLKKFKKYKIVLTNHNAKEGFLYRISTKLISNKVDIVVVTSEYSKTVFERYGSKNVINIEYPQLNDFVFDKKKSLEYFDIKTKSTVISCVGGTRLDKGIDIMLNALTKVNKPFHLLIAGREEYFSKDYIEQIAKPYLEKVTIYFKFLSDEEFAMAISCSDIVAVPYRKGFNGASGPLGEGVWRNKCIIGPKSKNLGDIIEKYHLGYTFIQENPDSLAELLNDVLDKPFEVDDRYLEYKKMISHKEFEKTYRDLYKILVTKKQ